METAILEQTQPVMKKEGEKCVVLLSGGIDSAVLMYSLVANYVVYPLTIDYGQRHRVKEVLAARNVCSARGDWLLRRWECLDLHNLRLILPSALTGASEIPSGEYDKESMSQTVVPNRNMIFLAIAAGYAEGMGASKVAYAAHYEDHYLYPDCRPKFIDSVGETIKLATDGKVALIEPFTCWTKADIIRLGKRLTVPFKLTYSCYKGGELHCGRCSTCIERRESFQKAGVKDPTEYTKEVKNE